MWELQMMRKGPVVRSKITNTTAQCNGREAGSVDCYTRRELRSSSSLKVDAIQTIDIFIRGYYL